MRLLILAALGVLMSLRACSYLPQTDQDFPDVLRRENGLYIELLPEGSERSKTGLIIYPGGLVDPHAYMDLASRFALSGAGHHVIIAKMPVNLAVMGVNAALKITGEFPGERWVLGGHSLGGAMACSLLDRDGESFEGLILMAAYSSGSVDLSAWDGAVLSITASKDQVLDWEKYEEAKSRLPLHSTFLNIEGGNHAGFGSYGEQKGDGDAEISGKEQHIQIVEHIQNFFLENGFE